VHPTGGSLRVFKPFAWLEVGSVKMALSRPIHQRVTQAVSPLGKDKKAEIQFLNDKQQQNLHKIVFG